LRLFKAKHSASDKSLPEMQLQNTNNDFLVISDNRVIHKIRISEIVHVESRGMHCDIHTCSGAMLSCCKNMGEICKGLESARIFFRVHTSYTINLNHVAKVKKEKSGTVIMSNGIIIPISKRRKSEFFSKHLAALPDFQ
jgi:two-component system LytT family response regulator